MGLHVTLWHDVDNCSGSNPDLMNQAMEAFARLEEVPLGTAASSATVTRLLRTMSNSRLSKRMATFLLPYSMQRHSLMRRISQRGLYLAAQRCGQL